MKDGLSDGMEASTGGFCSGRRKDFEDRAWDQSSPKTFLALAPPRPPRILPSGHTRLDPIVTNFILAVENSYRCGIISIKQTSISI